MISRASSSVSVAEGGKGGLGLKGKDYETFIMMMTIYATKNLMYILTSFSILL